MGEEVVQVCYCSRRVVNGCRWWSGQKVVIGIICEEVRGV